MAASLEHRISELKEQRAQAIQALVPEAWGDTPLREQQRQIARAEHSDEVVAINDTIDELRAKQIAARLKDTDDPFNQDELQVTIDVLERQGKHTLVDALTPLVEKGE
jgi:hypothetical protein